MRTTKTTAVTSSPKVDAIKLDNLTIDQLAELIQKAREAKSNKATPSIKINGHVNSVKKHVKAIQVALKKLSLCDGISPAKKDEIDSQLQLISVNNFRKHLVDIEIPQRRSKPKTIADTVVTDINAQANAALERASKRG